MNRLLLCTFLLASGAALAAPQDSSAPRDIDKVNGSIVAEAGQAYGRLETVNGGITLGHGARAAGVEAVNGGIQAGDDVTLRSASTVNGGIRFGQRARVAGDVETVNGGITLDRGSVVRGNVSTVNGGIGLLASTVEGRVETVTGDITVGSGSRVIGGIKVEKPKGGLHGLFDKPKIPRIVIGPDAVVDGPMVFEREVRLYVHARARIGSVTGASAIRYDGDRPPAN